MSAPTSSVSSAMRWESSSLRVESSSVAVPANRRLRSDAEAEYGSSEGEAVEERRSDRAAVACSSFYC